MGLETYQVARDHFEPDDNTGFAFPCCACRHRHGTDQEDPCIRCDWNLCAKPDDELPPNAEFRTLDATSSRPVAPATPGYALEDEK